jgi:hypothetical protein
MLGQIFPHQSIIDFSADKCPMIIGIMRRSLGKNKSFLTSTYEYEVLLDGDNQDLETMFNQLDDFREEFYVNEKRLMFVSVCYLLFRICVISFVVAVYLR